MGVAHEVVRYLTSPLTRAQLEALLDVLEDPPDALVRRDSWFKTLAIDAVSLGRREAVVDLLLEHPRLMQRPVLSRPGRAIIGRPKDRVAAFLATST